MPAGRSTSPLPLYFTAMMEIRENILAGEWQPGARIPGELTLAQKLGVSVVTVRQALARLVGEGYLEREKAKGTFVSASRPTRQSVDLEAGADALLTLDPSGTSFELISIGRGDPSSEVRRRLCLETDEEVTEIVRMRLWDSRPLARVVSHLPSRLARRIERDHMERFPLHKLVEQAAGICLTAVRHRIAARIADEEVAQALRIPAGSPVLWVERDYLQKRAVIVSSVGFYRSDLYNYELTLRRNGNRTGRKQDRAEEVNSELYQDYQRG